MARGYVSTAPRLRDFDGSTWMLAYSRGRTFAARVIHSERVSLPWHPFWVRRREALARCLRMARAA